MKCCSPLDCVRFSYDAFGSSKSFIKDIDDAEVKI